MTLAHTLRLPIVILIVLVAVSLFGQGRSGTPHVMTGAVVEWREGQSISVANEQTDPAGVRFDARGADHDRDRAAIRTGVRVAVWYRQVGERYPVAVKVQVLDPR